MVTVVMFGLLVAGLVLPFLAARWTLTDLWRSRDH